MAGSSELHTSNELCDCGTETLPLSSRLFPAAHNVLLNSVRGNYKMPGEYRTSQNWIGGSSLRDAIYIPPPHESVHPLMGDLENFLNNETIAVPHLIRIAIAHYQFETIHRPTLYLSDYFERNKELYYDNLTLVRTKDNLSQRIKFFLVGIIETAGQAADTFKAILKLRENIEGDKIIKLGRKLPFAKQLVNYLYKHPVVTSNDIVEEFDVTKPTAIAILTDFLRLGIVVERTGFARNRVYVFEDYLKLFR